MIVLQAEDDLRRPVKPRLHIGEGIHAEWWRGAKIDDLYVFAAWVRVDQVFRLQVAVDDLAVLDVDEALDYLEDHRSQFVLQLESFVTAFFQVDV